MEMRGGGRGGGLVEHAYNIDMLLSPTVVTDRYGMGSMQWMQTVGYRAYETGSWWSPNPIPLLIQLNVGTKHSQNNDLLWFDEFYPNNLTRQNSFKLQG